MEEGVGVGRHHYINSGVLLMNLKALREKEFDRHFLQLLNTYHFDCIAPDQDYLNAICAGKIQYLDGTWDTMPDDTKPPVANPKLIHYNLFSKPWCYDGIPYGETFWQYARKSDYYGDICAHKAAYGEEQKEKDRACLDLLVRRGGEIARAEGTFRQMYEKGVAVRL